MPQAIAAIVLIAILLIVGRSWLKKRTAAQLAAPEAGSSKLGAPPQGMRSAPLAEFHIVGDEARVTFDVPLDEEDDEILNDLLVDEAVEVVREKQHTLPIDEVHQVVVFAGRGSVREIGRTKLPSPGVLPPPPPVNMLNLGNVTRDPFTAEISTEHSVAYQTKADVPADELPPIGKELKIPKGLERGLRATGVEVSSAAGQDVILGLLRLFGYTVAATPEPNVYMASKAGETTLVVADPYSAGDYPEVEEGTIRAFAGRFSMSGANRGVFVSEKYAPFMIYSMEKNEPRIRFITRERLQEFIDLMALG
jgi:hypothetical protein